VPGASKVTRSPLMANESMLRIGILGSSIGSLTTPRALLRRPASDKRSPRLRPSITDVHEYYYPQMINLQKRNRNLPVRTCRSRPTVTPVRSNLATGSSIPLDSLGCVRPQAISIHIQKARARFRRSLLLGESAEKSLPTCIW
jgi:hypothetical protein